MNLNHLDIERLNQVVYLLKQQRKILNKIIEDGIGRLGPHDPRKEKLDFLEEQIQFWNNPKNF
jgi:hypothetical protein